MMYKKNIGPSPGEIKQVLLPSAAVALNFAKKFGDFLLIHENDLGSVKIKSRRFRQSILSVAIGALFFFPGRAQSTLSDSSHRELGLIQVISPKASIKIDSVKGLTMNPGDTLPLFQENEKYFIALAQDKYETPVLAAFPRMDFRKKASAWVTEQKVLVFANETSSRSGKMYLRKGENLPVLDEHQKTYEVTISRYGKKHRMEIPKKLSGIHYRPDAELPPELRPEEPRVRKIMLADLPPLTRPETPAAPSPARKNPSPGLLAAGSSLWADTLDKVVSAFEKDPAELSSPTHETAKKTKDRAVYYRPKNAYLGEEEDLQAESRFGVNLYRAVQEHAFLHHLLFAALLLLCTLLIIKYRSAPSPMTAESPPSEKSEPATPPGIPTPEPTPVEDADNPKVFTGSLDVFSITNLIQFLHNSSSTGVLNLEVKGYEDAGRVILNMGEVKHATFNGGEGPPAFVEILGLQSGLFRFKLSQQVKTKETIHTETSLLIEETVKVLALRNEQKIIKFGPTG